MTQDQKQIKIAEACGWTPSYLGSWTKDPAGLRGPFRHDLPDYFSDLNAMHEAEKVLTSHQQMMMYHAITKIIQRDKSEHTTWRATASQRAEAFGLTLNLWTTNDND